MSQDVDWHITSRNAPASPTNVMIALGGNMPSDVGAPEKTLRAALSRLSDSHLKVECASRFYATPCFPAGSGPEYVNAAAILSGSDDPHDVLRALHDIEAEFGRARDQRWGRRTLDLDLIAVGARVLPDADTQRHWRNLPLDRQMDEAPEHLILPHPRLQDRAFVLIPLAEIAPDWVHPISGQTVAEMAARLPEHEKLQVRPL